MNGIFLNNSRGNTIIRMVLIITSVVLLAGTAYGLFSLFSQPSARDNAVTFKVAPQKQAFHSAKPETQAAPEPQQLEALVATTPPLPPAKTMAPAKPVEPVVEEQEPEETWQETDERNAEKEYDIEQGEMRTEEIEGLKEALPGNQLIPFERTQEEVEALFAVAQELGAISESIENNTATPEDRQRYLDIVAQQFDDEIELIDYCNEMMTDPNNAISLELCGQLSKMGEERIQEIEGAREELRKKVMQ